MSEKKQGPDNIPPSPAVKKLVDQGMEAAKKVQPLDPANELKLRDGLTEILQKVLQPQQGDPAAGPQPDGPDSPQQQLTPELSNSIKKFFDNFKPQPPRPGGSGTENSVDSNDVVSQIIKGLQNAIALLMNHFSHTGQAGSNKGFTPLQTDAPKTLKPMPDTSTDEHMEAMLSQGIAATEAANAARADELLLKSFVGKQPKPVVGAAAGAVIEDAVPPDPDENNKPGKKKPGSPFNTKPKPPGTE